MIGSRFACTSSESVGVDLVSPVMLMAAMRWTVVGRLVIPLGPRRVLVEPRLKIGRNHMSVDVH